MAPTIDIGETGLYVRERYWWNQYEQFRTFLVNISPFLTSHVLSNVDFPPLLTIFSAPNYCDRYGNKAAILRIDIGLDGFHAIQYECVKHPEPEIVESQTDNYILAIISSCPYMPTSLRNLVKMALFLGPDVGHQHQHHYQNEYYAMPQSPKTRIVPSSTNDSLSALSIRKTLTPEQRAKSKLLGASNQVGTSCGCHGLLVNRHCFF